MFQEIDVREFFRRQENGERFHLLDVRQPWEHELVALPDSQLIPLSQLPMRLNEVQPAEGCAVVVYCHHGVRSRQGAALVASAGHRPVYSLAGGIEAWSVLVDPTVRRY